MEKTIKILLIEDDDFIRMLVKDIFWVHGKGKYQIFEARDIREGEKILAEVKPDLIFLDLIFQEDGLGSRSSLGLLEKIKSDPKTKDIKVIIFSGYPDLKERALELGAEKFLVKGEYLPKELFEIVENIVEQEK
jgi:CheY-like chemotaxis protein